MVPTKEIYDLARAIMRTDEFTNMMKYKKNIMGDLGISQKAKALEKEKNQILSGKLSPAEIKNRINCLINDDKALFDQNDISSFIGATESYQKMFAECMNTLHKAIDSYN